MESVEEIPSSSENWNEENSVIASASDLPSPAQETDVKRQEISLILK